jgi:hypothetical protein
MQGITSFGTGAVERGTFVMNADGSHLVRVTTKMEYIFDGHVPPGSQFRKRPEQVGARAACQLPKDGQDSTLQRT